jgi:hypothetical protein
MKLIGKAIVLGFAVGTATIMGCSDAGSVPSTSSGPSATVPGAVGSAGQSGTVGLQLQLAPGITLSSVMYTISNSTLSGFSTMTGTIDVSGSQTIGLTLTLPVGSGYSLSLSATDSSGDTCSAGPVTFSVQAGTSNAVGLTLVCRSVDGGGGGFETPDVGIGTVVITADASLQTTVAKEPCAAATSLVASPNEVTVGHGITLTGSGIDPSNGTSDVLLTWTDLGIAGSLVSSAGTSTTFNCTSPGTEIVTLTASISDGGASCPTIGSLNIALKCDAIVEAGADAGADTGSGADATSSDTGTDTGAETSADAGTTDSGGGTEAAAGPLVPCTTAGQTNCVSCGGNSLTTGPLANGLCTPTEAYFVQHDINRGVATAAGNDPAHSCYDCLFQNTCIDDTHFNDTGRECEDSVIVGPGATASANATLCGSVISCILGSATATAENCASANVADCYCGTAPVLGTCGGSASAANGVCDTTIAAALGFPVADGTDNLAQFTTGTVAGGVANQIFNCAQGGGCTACMK